MQKTSNVQELQAIARKVRRDVIQMITAAKSGHPGGSLSAVEILVTLFYDIMEHNPADPRWKDRDRFLLSKGHACPVLYSVMAECGYTPVDQLNTLRRMGSIYQGHPDVRFIPALEASTGSLGEGVSLGIGMALAAKLDNSPSRTYVVIGDGESQEGQIWEAAMFAPVHKVDNLVCIVDYNKIQLDGFVKDIMPLDPLQFRRRHHRDPLPRIAPEEHQQFHCAMRRAQHRPVRGPRSVEARADNILRTMRLVCLRDQASSLRQCLCHPIRQVRKRSHRQPSNEIGNGLAVHTRLARFVESLRHGVAHRDKDLAEPRFGRAMADSCSHPLL